MKKKKKISETGLKNFKPKIKFNRHIDNFGAETCSAVLENLTVGKPCSLQRDSGKWDNYLITGNFHDMLISRFELHIFCDTFILRFAKILYFESP